GVEEDVLLEGVLYQPEAARRKKEAPVPPVQQRRPALTLVQGGGQRTMETVEGFDDPGPSAA
ncbi:MAG: nucleoside-diphosphate kinase, partial [Pseudomonadota bacterium]|nr:nucleoside-diphosphate kinase [Pseudomonadota bacterium]